MKYLIKDLSKMTGIKGFTIRKWQERYSIFDPKLASNGYWYYTNEDYIVLTRIVNFLNRGERISSIVSRGRDYLLSYKNSEGYSNIEKKIIYHIIKNEYEEISHYLDEELERNTHKNFIRYQLRNIMILVGRAWNDGLVSVADEHSFSRWMEGYIYNISNKFGTTENPVWLVTSFPGDNHELGALMYYSLLRSRNIPAKFVGTLPLEHIIKELNNSDYKAISLSLALAQPIAKIEKVKSKILRKTNIKKVFFGGRGYNIVRESIKKERV
ncbi:MAG: MerR family transcriptional regulator [Leptospiraceae bacterium]|nr:MerR family transcriptional regulator [Leptospiraceae bacterium]